MGFWLEVMKSKESFFLIEEEKNCVFSTVGKYVHRAKTMNQKQNPSTWMKLTHLYIQRFAFISAFMLAIGMRRTSATNSTIFNICTYVRQTNNFLSTLSTKKKSQSNDISIGFGIYSHILYDQKKTKLCRK